jgi:hypothetical protein
MGAEVRVVNNGKFFGFHIQGDDVTAQEGRRRRLARLVSEHETNPLPEQPSSRKHPLYGPTLKLHVANQKIADLSTGIEGCLTSKLNTVRFEDDPERFQKVVRLVVGSPPDPRWDVEIGQIAVLLRSVLDITLTQLTKRTKRGPSRPQFPIFLWGTGKSRTTYAKAKGGAKMVAHLPPAEQAIIERAQPYHAGNLRRRHPLWLLHELSNLDKHNDLTQATTSVGSTALRYMSVPARLTTGGMYAKGGPMELYAGVPFEDGAILARVSREVNVKPQHSIAIRFAKGCPGAGDEVISTLVSIEKQVRKIIAEFFRLHP